jgi:hypothetical protein
MAVTIRSLAALLLGVSVAGFAAQAYAQPDVPKESLPATRAQISEHRAEALKRCTLGVQFASDTYVQCMLQEGENP